MGITGVYSKLSQPWQRYHNHDIFITVMVLTYHGGEFAYDVCIKYWMLLVSIGGMQTFHQKYLGVFVTQQLFL